MTISKATQNDSKNIQKPPGETCRAAYWKQGKLPGKLMESRPFWRSKACCKKILPCAGLSHHASQLLS